MLTASPITNQPVGKTFTFAIGLLGFGAAVELVLIGWAFWQRPPIALIPQAAPAIAQATPAPAAPAHPTVPQAASIVEESSSEMLAKGGEPTPPKPTPVTNRPPNTEPTNRFDELLTQGRELRDRSDTSTAITKFREAAAIDPKSPVPLAELAATYEKMGMGGKAAENYSKIVEMGPGTGPYWALAQAKSQLAKATALNQVVASQQQPSSSSPDPGVDTSKPVEGIATGAVLGLLPVSTEELRDDNSAKRFVLHIPIKARPKARIDVKDLIIHVLFYDIVDGQNVVQTSATVSSKWITQPPDWVNADTEELAVEYNLPKPSRRENRKYYGYIVRIYYKQQLQAATADPDRLAVQYPPPSTLPKDNEK
ncbi:MAG TPA: hypothetical protein VGM54_09800 [Chthoniobacter sp.]|jgi:hypothetical protein